MIDLQELNEEQRDAVTHPCVLWTAGTQNQGYGVTHERGKNELAHRVAYEKANGPIPEGMVIDHLCHNVDEGCSGGSTCEHRRCIEPRHLEAVPDAVNRQRGRHASGGTYQTHCKNGHLLDEDNTWEGTQQTQVGSTVRKRNCRACNRDAQRRYRERRLARAS